MPSTTIYSLPYTSAASPADAPTDEAAMMNAVDTALAGLWVNKSADETITNNTIQNDDQLFVSVAANSQYKVEMFLIYQATATPLIKIGWTAPAGATFNWVANGLASSVTASSSGVILRAGQVLADNPVLGTFGSIGVSNIALPSGWLTTTTAGTLQFQWAQSVTNATGSVVKAGSKIWLRKVA